MTKTKLAINGFGRIGRLLFKMALKDDNIDVVAINDLGDIENLAYLLRYDTAQKNLNLDVQIEVISEEEKYMIVGDEKFQVFSIKNPEELPWKKLDVDVVAECTGIFASYDKSNAHIEAGAKRVVISGSVKENQNHKVNENITGTMVLMGINENQTQMCQITSNASCTTNAAGTPLDILKNELGVESALLTTIHSYTSTQKIVDSSVKSGQKDFRRGRAGAMNIIPSTTGSAKAVGKVIEELEGNFDGIALRVPTIAGSVADITFIVSRDTTVEEVNEILEKASLTDKYKGILRVEKDQIVSSDIIGDTHAAVVDANFTKVVGRLVKILVWYDNETGYTNMMLNHIKEIAKHI